MVITLTYLIIDAGGSLINSLKYHRVGTFHIASEQNNSSKLHYSSIGQNELVLHFFIVVTNVGLKEFASASWCYSKLSNRRRASLRF